MNRQRKLTRSDVMDYLFEVESTNKNSFAKRFGVHYKTAEAYLNELADEKIVKVETYKTPKGYNMDNYVIVKSDGESDGFNKERVPDEDTRDHVQAQHANSD